MDEEFDISVDTSFDDTTLDVPDSGGSFESGDVDNYMSDTVDANDYADDFYETSSDIGTLMDESADISDIMDSSAEIGVTDDQTLDVGELDESSSDIGSLMDDVSDVDSIMDGGSDADLYQATPISDIPIVQEDGSVDTLENIMAANADTDADVAPDVEPYQATPISDMQIVQEDGSVDTLENIMAANADTDADVAPDVEPYQATPISDMQIAQEDGSVDTLENIMAANADTDADVAPDVEPYQATPISDMQIVQEDGSVDTLENIMAANADTDVDAAPDVKPQGVPDFTDTPDVPPVDADDTVVDAGTDPTDTNDSAYAQLMAYMSDHNYGRQHEAEYTQDPEWQELNNAYRIEQGLEPIDYGTQDWTDTHVDDTRAELVAMGIPEDSPELEAILQNEQQGIDQIRNGEMDVDDSPMELDSDVIDTADEAVDGDDGSDIGDVVPPTGDPIHMTQSDVDWYMENAGDSESLRQMRDGIASGRIIVDADTEIPSDAAIEGISDVPADIDYDAVYSGLDSYDFDGIDVSTDVERLDSSLDSFQSGTWENLSTDEQKAAMSDLADYVKDVIGFENPPDIVYYNNPVDGDYGGYSPSTNTLSVNEYMLYDNNEAADTVAHELWHAYQHERAMNPQSAKDYQYQYGFDNYIRPDDDFTAYQDQLVEAEARAFAQQFKDRLRTKGRRI